MAIGGTLIAAPWITGTTQAVAMPVLVIASPSPEIRVAETIPALESAPPPDRVRVPGYVAQTPKLDPACVGQAELECIAEKTGFPAISADRKWIADAITPDDGMRGYPGLVITFTEVATSRLLRSRTILSASEWDPAGNLPVSRATIRQRTAAAMRELVGYRSLHAFDTDSTSIHAEWDDDTLRIVDDAGAVFGRRVFVWDHPHDHEHCSHVPRDRSTWWDPVTGIGLVRQYYSTGDFCGNPTVEQVFEI